MRLCLPLLHQMTFLLTMGLLCIYTCNNGKKAASDSQFSDSVMTLKVGNHFIKIIWLLHVTDTQDGFMTTIVHKLIAC